MSLTTILSASVILAVANAHGVLLNAQGLAGSPASVGFQVDLSIPRNCTTISPCQQDTTIIRDSEITANVVNECGRTELMGNIDVGENTENALAAGAVTEVKAGSQITVTIHQVNADGAGPYFCDLDETSNSGVISQNLTVTNNVPGANGLSQAKEQDFNITVTMPDNFACTGASTGNVCTVRCRNNAVAGPFGGCFAVQQTDVTAKVNTPQNIDTAATLDTVLSQVLQNQQDLPVALAANAQAGASEAQQNAAAVDELLGITVTTKASSVQTPDVALGGSAQAAAASATTTSAAASSTTAATSTKGSKTGKKKNNAAADASTGNEKEQTQKRGSFTRNLRWAKRMVLAEDGGDSF